MTELEQQFEEAKQMIEHLFRQNLELIREQAHYDLRLAAAELVCTAAERLFDQRASSAPQALTRLDHSIREYRAICRAQSAPATIPAPPPEGPAGEEPAELEPAAARQ